MSSKSPGGGCVCACIDGSSSSLFPLPAAVVVCGSTLVLPLYLVVSGFFHYLQCFMMAYVHRSLPQKSCPGDELANKGDVRVNCP
jgi:hypothetical protein